MPHSRYDKDVRALRDRYDADAVFIVVFGGTRGVGATMACRAEVQEAVVEPMVATLRAIADDMEKGVTAGILRRPE